jgi:hypothetical protein
VLKQKEDEGRKELKELQIKYGKLEYQLNSQQR